MVCENALGSRKSPLIGTCLKSSLKVGVCVYISRAVSVKLASAKLFLSPSQWDLNLPLLFLLMSQHSFEMNENGFLIPCWCEHTFWLSTNLRRGPPIQPINSIDVTVGNQLDYWAGVILCFISVCQALDFFACLYFFYAFLLLCLNLLINCYVHPWFSFTSYQFLHVTILSPLLCLTFPSVLLIFYLALTKATIINTCLCDTCPILFPLISVGLIATVKFFPWCSCKFQINSSHITQLSHHLVFLHVGICFYGEERRSVLVCEPRV